MLILLFFHFVLLIMRLNFLDEQEEAMLKQVDLQIRQAQAQHDLQDRDWETED